MLSLRAKVGEASFYLQRAAWGNVLLCGATKLNTEHHLVGFCVDVRLIVAHLLKQSGKAVEGDSQLRMLVAGGDGESE